MPVLARGMVARAAGEPARLEEIEVGDPGPGEVLVRVLASGVCHTDLHQRNDPTRTTPVLLGHEGAGVVEVTGPGVMSPVVGETVALAWRAPCGACRFCRFGEPQWCAASLQAAPRLRAGGDVLAQALRVGSLSTHTVVHASQAVPVPLDLPPDRLCLLGCGVMTGVGAALYTAAVRPGTSVAVIGCGGLGTSVVQGARLAGATTIVAVDVDERKLAWARELGATHAVDATREDVVGRVVEIAGGHGVRYAFDVVGRPETLAQALGCRDMRGTAVMVGLPARDAVFALPMREFMGRFGTLKVCYAGDAVPSRDFPLLAAWYRDGRLKLDYPVTTQTLPLEEAEEAFAAMERSETLRSVVRMP